MLRSLTMGTATTPSLPISDHNEAATAFRQGLECVQSSGAFGRHRIGPRAKLCRRLHHVREEKR